MSHRVKLSKNQSRKIDEAIKGISNIPYASGFGSIQYAIQCTRPDSVDTLSVTIRYVLVINTGLLSRLSLSTYEELRICSLCTGMEN
ncbi:UNVERIFIED_CONTAM: hypothetical protein Sradi_5754100 [Sesamum radiatum]|uniref:Uncharacterized protein n=1 Tax=Sesamum radiatum TaxID=300843 RepID=A0AAW2L3V7_SESRA